MVAGEPPFDAGDATAKTDGAGRERGSDELGDSGVTAGQGDMLARKLHVLLFSRKIERVQIVHRRVLPLPALVHRKRRLLHPIAAVRCSVGFESAAQERADANDFLIGRNLAGDDQRFKVGEEGRDAAEKGGIQSLAPLG
ncbi:hypothetical protein IEQ34_021213 [Dendrobium chrysotoxum]|uniref:Uncharacterized protein n=1 Tax=Dendrobium chrysotoxum TaxID=161865 RepID=A0AAV7G2H7_DENCH|nr:hypothetical protein IEQ34_021213 [Dendrobium chrysotoxum]